MDENVHTVIAFIDFETKSVINLVHEPINVPINK